MYDFVNCDYNSIKSNLVLLDQNGIFNSLDVDDAVNIFYENVFKTIPIARLKLYTFQLTLTGSAGH